MLVERMCKRALLAALKGGRCDSNTYEQAIRAHFRPKVLTSQGCNDLFVAALR